MIAFSYPGQGAQRAGMLHDLPSSPAVARTLEEARAHRPDLDELDGSLTTTTPVQLCLLVASVAGARALIDDGARPGIVAGHSVGAFPAAVTAGVLTLPEALDAVALRGRLMEQACSGGGWGMAVLLGLRPASASALVDDVGSASDPLWVANVNAADQTVLAGTATALDRAHDAARDAGARELRRLDVAVASHGPIQQPTADAMAAHLADVPRRDQQVPYLSNLRGRRIRRDADAVLDDLARSVAHTVRWYDAVRLAEELGVDDWRSAWSGK